MKNPYCIFHKGLFAFAGFRRGSQGTLEMNYVGALIIRIYIYIFLFFLGGVLAIIEKYTTKPYSYYNY